MSIACVGDNVIDIYLGSGRGYPGGNAVNVAVAAGREPACRRRTWARWARTARAAILRQALASQRVATERLRVLPGNTAWCEVRLVDGDREWVGDTDVGVSRIKLTGEPDLDYLAGFSVVHTGDNSMLEAQVADIAARGRKSPSISASARANMSTN